MAKEPRKEHKRVHVPQKSKIKTELVLRSLPWTDKQKEFFKLVQDRESKIIFVKGPAGTSKTLCAVFTALLAMNEKRIGEIVYVRSIVESSSHSLGFLPGTKDEKLSPYIQPMMDKLEELLTEGQIKMLLNAENVRGIPVGFLRGLSINAAYIIGDEAQNFTAKELLTLCTRVGKFSKLILCGDVRQSDIRDSGFLKVFELFNNEESASKGIKTFSFGLDDIMRSEVVKFIVQKFEQLSVNS